MPNCRSETQQPIIRTVAGLLLISLTTFGLTGCGGDEKEAPAGTAGQSPVAGESPNLESGNEPKASSEDENVGSVKGVVMFSGQVPELKMLIEQGSEVKDAKVCSVHAIPDESLVVNSENQGVANVFVFLGRAPRGVDTRTPQSPVVIDQKGCRFFPHALLTQTGQTLTAISSDDVAHNIHTFPLRNEPINTIMQANDQKGLNMTLTRPESQPFKVYCDIHPWMAAYVLVLDHPFMAVTDENGEFEIPDLPVGTQNLKIWHERVGFLEKEYEVTIEKDTPTEIELEYAEEKFAAKEIAGLKSVVFSANP